MSDTLRKGAICFTSLITMASFTVISPFYTAIALRQGIPPLLIGFIFSTFPIAGLISAIWIPKLMFCIGRHRCLLLGLAFICSSNILISFLESVSTGPAIAISFVSRAISGTGAAHSFISGMAILISDYPSERAKLAALSEACAGAGLIIGPSFGSLIFVIGGFSNSCSIIGIIACTWMLILFFLLGPQRSYKIEESKEEHNIMAIAMKPVIFI